MDVLELVPAAEVAKVAPPLSLYDLELELSALADCLELVPPETPIVLSKVKGDIGFRDVNFSYVPDRPVLPDLDLVHVQGLRRDVADAGVHARAGLLPEPAPQA